LIGTGCGKVLEEYPTFAPGEHGAPRAPREWASQNLLVASRAGHARTTLGPEGLSVPLPRHFEIVYLLFLTVGFSLRPLFLLEFHGFGKGRGTERPSGPSVV